MNERRDTALVAYLGPEGTYSHAAVLKFFGSDQPMLPFTEIPDIFASVEQGESEFGLVPVENSTEGSVTLTLDCFNDSDLLICGEEMLRINHYLLVGPGTAPDAIERIVTHQQSLGQCRQWLKQHYPRVERVSVSSNAEAAKIAARHPGVAAIAGRTAAELYGLRVVAEHIEDTHDNTTRFLVLSRTHRPGASGDDKTSIIISAPDEPGTLFRALEPFHRYEVSLTKLESRPSRREAWSYSFYVDMKGHVEDPKVRTALEDLKKLALEVRMLGSYPAAR